MQLSAPAKINLSFRIKRRRDDGFHEIETLMAPVSIFDVISVEKLSGPEGRVVFSCNDPSIPSGEDNLVVRAARLFQETTRNFGTVEIRLDKKIPHGAGLGGGSSDAATTLLGLNRLLAAGLSADALMKLGAQLGSDVPFFIAESSAICRGRGEIVESTLLPRQLKLVLFKPHFGVATPDAYRRWQKSLELPGIGYEVQKFGGLSCWNDLERPVFEKFVSLANFKMWLRRQAEVAVALMSGSGSTLFAIPHEGADSAALMERARREIDPTLWTAECETIGATSASASPPRTRDSASQ